MGRDFGANLLSAEERETFERDGYIRFPGALDADLNARCVEAVDRAWEEGFEGDLRLDKSISQRFNLLGFIGHDRLFFDLVCYEKILPKMFGILGWNIYLYHSHMTVSGREDGIYDPGGPTWGWHQDSGQLNNDLETNPRPRISVKVAYFLTDVSEPAAAASPRGLYRSWPNPATRWFSTGGSGTRPPPTTRTSPARSSSTGTVTAGSMPATK